MDEYAEWFGARLREALGAMPQVDLVELIKGNGFEITPGRLSHYMQGRRYPDPPALKEMAKALGVSADWLLGLTEESATVAELEEQLARAKGESPIDKLMEKLPPGDREQVITFANYLLAQAGQTREERVSRTQATLRSVERDFGTDARDYLVSLGRKEVPARGIVP